MRSYLALLLLALGVSESLAASCTFTDAASAKSGKGSCSTITLSNIKVPAGQTLDLTGLNSGTKVIFSGTTTFGYAAWEGPLISVSGSNIDVSGASGSLIDGGGAQWWDGKGTNGGKTKPKFFYAHGLTNSNIRYLNVKNTPVQGFSINGCTNLNVDHVTIDNSAGDANDLGHNTDAFARMACSSPTQIVGGRSDNTVDGVRIIDSQVVNSDNAVRIKTVSGATGTVNNVTYSNIKLSGIAKYGIDIQQDYLNGGPTGSPTNGVKISNVNIKGVTGSVNSGATEVYILCGSGSCSNWKWSGVSISGGSKSTKCKNVPSPASC
ncbi:endopolygalacturonase [Pseudozyma hubeiensis SY62]|uniref:endo-polygalacturonase n=1 Tax=Pseudozyma hubeiensis (strain SY62) TaxID=1305764 RepID=R9P7F1_PSEHS|nr:endopolygalacturonase [Pseudozyma hubeiensis SY62]GAC94030.1 endopolygalacturonase [Pseudozyma hubeiensis SY62]